MNNQKPSQPTRDAKPGLSASDGSANFDPTLWRERVYVQDVKQEHGEIWLRISAANAPRGTPPVACFAAGQILVIEIKHDPLGVHSPNDGTEPHAPVGGAGS